MVEPGIPGRREVLPLAVGLQHGEVAEFRQRLRVDLGELGQFLARERAVLVGVEALHGVGRIGFVEGPAMAHGGDLPPGPIHELGAGLHPDVRVGRHRRSKTGGCGKRAQRRCGAGHETVVALSHGRTLEIDCGSETHPRAAERVANLAEFRCWRSHRSRAHPCSRAPLAAFSHPIATTASGIDHVERLPPLRPRPRPVGRVLGHHAVGLVRGGRGGAGQHGVHAAARQRHLQDERRQGPRRLRRGWRRSSRPSAPRACRCCSAMPATRSRPR